MAVFPLRLVPPNTKIDFIGRRKLAFVFSALLVAFSLGFFAVKGLNYGIDFKGGILMEVRTPGAAEAAGAPSPISCEPTSLSMGVNG